RFWDGLWSHGIQCIYNPLWPLNELHCKLAEISLWTIVAAIQAGERKVDSQAKRGVGEGGRMGTAEKKLIDCERTVMEFGNQLGSKWAMLETLIQDYNLLQRT
ncbi:zinc finger protein 282, partial [Chelydra serpentina]